MEYILIFYLSPFYPIHFFLTAFLSSKEEGSISMGGANPDSTNGIKNQVLFK